MIRHLPFALLLLSTSAHAIDVSEARLQLLEQVRAGESRNKVELIEESLYRLFKLNPDDPEGLAAMARLHADLIAGADQVSRADLKLGTPSLSYGT